MQAPSAVRQETTVVRPRRSAGPVSHLPQRIETSAVRQETTVVRPRRSAGPVSRLPQRPRRQPLDLRDELLGVGIEPRHGLLDGVPLERVGRGDSRPAVGAVNGDAGGGAGLVLRAGGALRGVVQGVEGEAACRTERTL